MNETSAFQAVMVQAAPNVGYLYPKAQNDPKTLHNMVFAPKSLSI